MNTEHTIGPITVRLDSDRRWRLYETDSGADLEVSAPTLAEAAELVAERLSAEQFAAHDAALLRLAGDGGWRCVSDRYDADGGTYASTGEFEDMCRSVFGSAPELVWRTDGWHDDRGLVLVEAR